jgi:hypothetical protein
MLAMAGCVPFVPGAAQAQSTAPTASAAVGIESPRDGTLVASSTLPRPHGFAGSASGVGDVQLILQRASGAGWLSWNGSGWAAKTSLLPASYDNVAREWEWSDAIDLPHGELLPSGAYRLQAVARARDGSTLGRAVSDFTVRNTAGVAPATINRMDVPSNDAYQNAVAISGASGQTTGSSVDATNDVLPGISNYGRKNVWWKWTAPGEQRQLVTFDTAGSNFNTVLVVDRFATETTAERVGVNEDAPGAYTSRLRFEAEPNREYYIGVEGEESGVAGLAGSGSVVLTWSTTYRPPNDSWKLATSITGAAGRVTGSSVDATNDVLPGISNYGRKNVWWKWTAPGEQRQLVTFDTAGSNFNTVLVVDRFTTETTAERVGINDDSPGAYTSRFRFEAEPNREYYIGVEGDESGVAGLAGSGSVVLTWSTTYRPSNDSYLLATNITGAAGRVTGSSVDATNDVLPGISNYGRNNVWWKWTAPSTPRQLVTFDTVGSSFNTVLVVDRFASTSPGSTATRVGIVDDSPGGYTSRFRFEAEPGRVYYIGVEGNGSGVAGLAGSGSVVLTWSTTYRPPNDSWKLATSITGAQGRVIGRSVDATIDVLPGISNYGRNNVWWKWTAPGVQGQLVTFNTAGSNFNTVLVVDRFATTTTAQRVGINDDAPGAYTSRLSFQAEPNRVYYIGVENNESGAGGVAGSGNVVLNWRTEYQRPVNDSYGQATPISGTSGRATGTNVGATVDFVPGTSSFGRPNVCGSGRRRCCPVDLLRHRRLQLRHLPRGRSPGACRHERDSCRKQRRRWRRHGFKAELYGFAQPPVPHRHPRLQRRHWEHRAQLASWPKRRRGRYSWARHGLRGPRHGRHAGVLDSWPGHRADALPAGRAGHRFDSGGCRRLVCLCQCACGRVPGGAVQGRPFLPAAQHARQRPARGWTDS